MCGIRRGSRAVMFPRVLIACLLWSCFGSHGYSRRGIDATRWWRLKRKNTWSFGTREGMQLHGSKEI